VRGWVGATLALYGRVLRQAVVLAARNWAVMLMPVVYAGILGLATVVGAVLGPFGPFLRYLAYVVCASSWLALAGEIIRTGRVRLADVPTSFGAYVNDLLVVGFVVWGIQLVIGFSALVVPFAAIVLLLAMLVFLNAVPELIYLGRHAPMELLPESYRFIVENWIEWFPPNVPLVLVMLLGPVVLLAPDAGSPAVWLYDLVFGAVAYVTTLVRGLLFLELAGSTRRSREFRRRAAG
jgi:hypothetical protein